MRPSRSCDTQHTQICDVEAQDGNNSFFFFTKFLQTGDRDSTLCEYRLYTHEVHYLAFTSRTAKGAPCRNGNQTSATAGYKPNTAP